MSALMKVAATFVRLTRKRVRTAGQLEKSYRGRAYPEAAPITRSLRRKVEVREETVLGCRLYTLTPRTGASHWHIVYTHGGCFVNALVKAHWDIIEKLVDSTGATVSVPLYRLAPQHAHAETYALLEHHYRDLVARVGAEHVVLCGDSAGGNLALVQALRARDLGLPRPAHLILFAPWVELTMVNGDVAAIQPRDPMLHSSELVEFGRWWAGEKDPRAPLLSPLLADLRDLPPVHIYQGTDDVLLPDARLLRDRIAAAGGTVHYHESDKAFHVFMGATFVPEARAVFASIQQTLTR